MRSITIATLACLTLLCACRKEESGVPEPVPGAVGEDGRYDCPDSTMTPQELTQWDWLQRGFRIGSRRAEFPAGSFRVRIVRREPRGVELLVQLERSGSGDRALLIRPRARLHEEFVAASMEKGLVAGLWDPRTPLDTLLLPDSVAKAGMDLIEERGLSHWTSMRRCDTADRQPSPLGEALYVLELEGPQLQRLHVLRPGHYAEDFWNRLQRLVDRQEKFSSGVGF